MGKRASHRHCRSGPRRVGGGHRAPPSGLRGADLRAGARARRVRRRHQHQPQFGESSFDALDLADKLHAIASEPIGLTWRDWGSDDDPQPSAIRRFREALRRQVLRHRIAATCIACSRRRCRRTIIHLGKRCTAVESRNGTAAPDASPTAPAPKPTSSSVATASARRFAPACSAAKALTTPERCAGARWRPPTRCRRTITTATSTNGPATAASSSATTSGRASSSISSASGSSPAGPSSPGRCRATSMKCWRPSPMPATKLRRMMAAATSCSKWGQFTGEHAPQWTKDRVDAARQFRARHACDLRARRQHGLRGRLCPGAMAARQAPTIRTRRWPATKRPASRGRRKSSSSRAPKSASRSSIRTGTACAARSTFIKRHGSTTSGVYRFIFGYDPVTQWQG